MRDSGLLGTLFADLARAGARVAEAPAVSQTAKASAVLNARRNIARKAVHARILKFLRRHIATCGTIALEVGLSDEWTRTALIDLEAAGSVRRERDGRTHWWRLA